MSAEASAKADWKLSFLYIYINPNWHFNYNPLNLYPYNPNYYIIFLRMKAGLPAEIYLRKKTNRLFLKTFKIRLHHFFANEGGDVQIFIAILVFCLFLKYRPSGSFFGWRFILGSFMGRLEIHFFLLSF